MAKIVAVASQKGGVGKTTTAVNLSAAAAALGWRVLLVDLDPQGSATSGLGIDKSRFAGGTYPLLLGSLPAKSALCKTAFGLDLLPANRLLAGAALELAALPGRERSLRRGLAPLLPDYDFIFIDCPPGLDLLALSGLCAADSVLVPVQCEFYALECLSELTETLRTVRRLANPYLELEGVLLTMVSPRSALGQEVARQVRRHFGRKVYPTPIPRTARLAEAPGYGQPIGVYAPADPGAKAYAELAQTLCRRPEPKEADSL